MDVTAAKVLTGVTMTALAGGAAYYGGGAAGLWETSDGSIKNPIPSSPSTGKVLHDFGSGFGTGAVIGLGAGAVFSVLGGHPAPLIAAPLALGTMFGIVQAMTGSERIQAQGR